jgi:cobalt-zinc-cadmium efflux system outer membrane protein
MHDDALSWRAAYVNCRSSFIAVVILVLAGCADRSPEDGLAALRTSVGVRAGGDLVARTTMTERAAAKEKTDLLLTQELSLDAALQLALLNAPRYQTLYAQIGIAAAEQASSTALTNPIFSAMVRPTTSPAALANLEFGILTSLVDLLKRPARGRAALGIFEAERLSVAADVVAAALAVRNAYVDLLAATNIRDVQKELERAAAASAAVAERFHAAGNIPLVRLREEQAAAADASLSLTDAEMDVIEARERFALAVGIDASLPWRVPAALPAAPKIRGPAVAGGIEQRLDVQASRAAASAAVGDLKLHSDWRLWRELGLEVSGERDGDGQWAIGPKLEVALPIFNQGRPDVARAAAAAIRADHQRVSVEQAAASDLRLAQARLGQAERRLVRYRDEIVPLHTEIVDLKLLEYNYMFVGVFEVLTARRAAATAEVGYIAALRDFWKARLGLDAALGGGTALALVIEDSAQ